MLVLCGGCSCNGTCSKQCVRDRTALRAALVTELGARATGAVRTGPRLGQSVACARRVGSGGLRMARPLPGACAGRGNVGATARLRRTRDAQGRIPRRWCGSREEKISGGGAKGPGGDDAVAVVAGGRPESGGREDDARSLSRLGVCCNFWSGDWVRARAPARAARRARASESRGETTGHGGAQPAIILAWRRPG